MAGNKVVLNKYKIIYNEFNEERIVYVDSNEEKEEWVNKLNELKFKYSIEEIDQTNKWIEGMEFESREEALKALELGKEKYEEYKFKNNPELQNSSMLLDLDYRMGLFEMGVK
jgi:hypothetical protein